MALCPAATTERERNYPNWNLARMQFYAERIIFSFPPLLKVFANPPLEIKSQNKTQCSLRNWPGSIRSQVNNSILHLKGHRAQEISLLARLSDAGSCYRTAVLALNHTPVSAAQRHV